MTLKVFKSHLIAAAEGFVTSAIIYWIAFAKFWPRFCIAGALISFAFDFIFRHQKSGIARDFMGIKIDGIIEVENDEPKTAEFFYELEKMKTGDVVNILIKKDEEEIDEDAE